MSNYQLHVLTVVSLSSQLCGIAVVVFFPLRRLIKRGELKRAVLQMWLNYFIWSIAFCFGFPNAAALISHDKRVYECFPEMTGIVPIALLGWIPSLILCGVVWLIRNRFKRNHSE
jgi:hypothetical protein